MASIKLSGSVLVGGEKGVRPLAYLPLSNDRWAIVAKIGACGINYPSISLILEERKSAKNIRLGLYWLFARI